MKNAVMKKIFIAFMLLNAFMSPAQNINIADHTNGIDAGRHIIAINSKYYYLHSSVYHSPYYCYGNELGFVSVNNTGQTLFETGLLSNDLNRPSKLAKTKDNCAAILVLVRPQLQGSKNIFAKIDTNGIVKFQIDISYTGTDSIKDFTQHTDSSYYLVSDNLMYHYSKDGQFIAGSNTGLTGIASVTTLNNGNLLLNAKINNVQNNIEMTVANVIVNQQPTASTIIKFVQNAAGDLYAGTTGGQLEKYNAGLNFVNTSPLTGVKAFVMKNDSLFVTGLATTASIFYSVLDQGLAPLYQAQTNYKRVYPNSIAINNKNKISIMTVGTSSPNLSVTFTGLYQMPVNGNFASRHDVGVTKITAAMANYTFATNPPAQVGFPGNVLYNLNITVKNYGTDTVKSFKLNRHFLNSGGSCLTLLDKRYDTIIPPHDSVLVQTGYIAGEMLGLSLPNVQANTPYYINFCYFTTVPNGSNDINVSNDEKCESIQIIQSATGIEKNSLNAASINVFPNPFNQAIAVNAEIEIKRIFLYNALGVIQYEAGVNKKEAIIETLHLPPGIYFIKLQTEKGTVIKKVVKE